MPRVFLSYRHVEPDQSIAKYIYRYLTDLDHEVFFDSENLSVGTFWHKEIRSKIERAEWFIPLISLAYLNSPYILEHELSVAAQRLKAEQIEGILQVNLAFDGTPPDAVKEVVTQIQFLKWKSPDDTPELARDLAEKLPSPRLLVKGMRSFGVTDGPQFEQLGRADQISQFITLLNQQTNRLTLLHGVSGSGKTSFIKAGVLPKIRNEGAIVYELERDTPGELDVLNSEKASIIILDQFEQSLIRLSAMIADSPIFDRRWKPYFRSGSIESLFSASGTNTGLRSTPCCPGSHRNAPSFRCCRWRWEQPRTCFSCYLKMCALHTTPNSCPHCVVIWPKECHAPFCPHCSSSSRNIFVITNSGWTAARGTV
jgi:hypothetical protein